MRICKKCSVEKPLEQFPVHSGVVRRWTCKECLRAYHRTFSTKPEQKAKRQEYRVNHRALYNHHNSVYRKKFPDRNRDGMKKRRQAVPGMMAAHNKVARAIKRGVLEKQPCVMCGSIDNVQAHHEDYSKPLHVKWLCPLHHRHEHVAQESNP